MSDLTATATELNYTDGVTSSIQDQLDDRVKHYEQLPVASAENAGALISKVTPSVEETKELVEEYERRKNEQIFNEDRGKL